MYMNSKNVHFGGRVSRRLCVFGLLAGIAPAIVCAQSVDRDADEFFERRIRPTLTRACIKCHGEKRQEAGLRLDSREGLLKGGERGPAIVPGKPQESILLEAVRQTGELIMPPEGQLTGGQIADLARWIEMGAHWPNATAASPLSVEASKRHWAFQPVRKPTIPAGNQLNESATAIDRFIINQLGTYGIKPSRPADRRTLLRRASIDLVGLPPSPDELTAVENDASPDAFGQLVDRLLASPHYGERWGRYWLDVARYADTKGYVFFDDKRYPWAYTYRDYVVRSLNNDLRYDRFIVEQLAADQLDLGDDQRPLTAMGFLSAGNRFMNNPHDIIDDQIDVVTRGLLGLTVTCARCHDHKYDPIPTEDYYSLYGVFASSREPAILPVFEPPAPTREYESFRRELAAREQKLTQFVETKYSELVGGARSRAGDYLKAAHATRQHPTTEEFMLLADTNDLNPVMIERWKTFLARNARKPDPVFLPWHACVSLPADRFVEKANAKVAELLRPEARPPVNPIVARALAARRLQSLADLADRYGEVFKAIETEWRKANSEAASNKKPGAQMMSDPAKEELRQVLYGRDSPASMPMPHAGDLLPLLPDRPSQEEWQKRLKAVQEWLASGPGAPPRAMVLHDTPKLIDPRVFLRGNPNRPSKPIPRQFVAIATHGQRKPFERGSGRMELAQAIADPKNPLTARVLVNRVWMHHFGAPLVRTPGDFGIRSDPPSHPELLDYLAATFVEDGWSIKALHRKIMLSATYQQESFDRPECAAIDPENRLVWRANRRRLDFESMRDSLAAVSGHLDQRIGGPPFDLLKASQPPRRTVYGFIERLELPGLFRAFDFPSPETASPQRTTTVVAPQALFLMNHPYVLECASHLARRLTLASPNDAQERIQRLFQAVYLRQPNADEQKSVRRFLGKFPLESSAWEQLAQTLLMSNEFLYVE